MNIEAPKNINYCATVVQLDKFVELPNCNNLKAAIIFGNSVIVSNDTPLGEIGLFFPVEVCLSRAFLYENDLYRDSNLNADPSKKGYFEAHGRIKCIKFRGNKSEGFYVPLSFLIYIIGIETYYTLSMYDLLSPGTEFDTLDGQEICRKYVPKLNPASIQRQGKGKTSKPSDKIVANQFRFHIDTMNLRRNSHKILPQSLISVTEKWHGTSAIFANVLVKRDLGILERLMKWIGWNIVDTKYDIVHASRRVVKGVGEKEKDGIHFYGDNLWGVVAKELKGVIPKGYTLYCEIVGFTPEGKVIQKGYSYGCKPREHKTLVYRITVTNEDGFVTELGYNERVQFCGKFGLEAVRYIYFGYAHGILPGIYNGSPEWSEAFTKYLEDTYVNRECPHNPGKPFEGVVVRVERFDECESYKLKNFDFLAKESRDMDADEMDMETLESLEEQDQHS